MDGLNNSVITGACSECVTYKEKVARLEERIVALEAALRPFVALLEQYITRSDYFEDGTVVYAINDAQVTVGDLFQARDATLSGAGRGWLPPRVREQARLAIGHAFHLIEHNKAMCVRCREAKQRLSAALDALKGE